MWRALSSLLRARELTITCRETDRTRNYSIITYSVDSAVEGDICAGLKTKMTGYFVHEAKRAVTAFVRQLSVRTLLREFKYATTKLC
jgi:hypothetical protein